MPTLSLIGHVQRCPQNDGASTRCFSLNLSAAIDPGGTPADAAELKRLVRRYLRPWMWGMDPAAGDEGKEGPLPARNALLRVAVIGTDGMATLLDAVPASAPRIVGSAARAAWRAELNDRLGDLDAVPESFTWPPAAVLESMEYDGDQPDTLKASRRWHAELLDHSRGPAPLPHEAQLTWFFSVPAANYPAGATVTAAPAFSFPMGEDDTFPAPQGPALRPAWRGAQIDVQAGGVLRRTGAGAASHMRWDYEVEADGSAPDPAVTAYLNEASDADAAPGRWSNGWVKLDDALYGEDWLGELEVRAADLFDLPALLLRWVETLPDAERGIAASDLRPLVHATLRDLVQTGATCGSRVIPGAPRRGEAEPVSLAGEYGLAGDMLREAARLAKDYGGGAPTPEFAARARQILERLEAWETAGTGPEPLAEWWKAVLKRALHDVSTDVAKLDDGATAVARAEREAEHFSRLRALQAWFTDDDRARALVFEQWDHLLRDRPDLWQPLRDTMRSQVLPALGVRKRLALQHLGVEWAQTVRALGSPAAGGGSAREQVAAKLADALHTAIMRYARDRAGAADRVHRDLPAPDAVVPAAALERFATWLRGYLPEAVIREVLAGGEALEEAEAEPGHRPDALVLHVADVAGESPDEEDEADDPLRGIAGFGILLRPRTEGGAAAEAPSCVTLADIHLKVQAGGAGPALAPGAVVPVRIAVRNGVRRALVSYDNEPVCAESPLATLALNRSPRDEQAVQTGERLRYCNPYGSADRSPRLIALRYGGRYETAAFTVGVGGNLPAAVAAAGDPTRFDPDVAAASGAIPWRPFEYRRRVAVGPLRLQSPGRRAAFGDTVELPPVPESVHPLARSLDGLVGREDDPAAIEKRAEELRRSVVLLVPPADPNVPSRVAWKRDAAKRFEFAVRPPSADIQLWDRSFEFEAGAPAGHHARRTPKQRRDVWMETFARTRDNLEAPEGVDTTLDDPAAVGVYVRLKPLFPSDAANGKPLTCFVAFSTRTGSGGIDGERSAAVPCAIESAAGGQARLLSVGARISVTVPKGQVWLLELFTALDARSEPLFQPKLWGGYEAVTDSGRQLRLAAPRRMAVEVATEEMPGEADLHDALRARAVAGGKLGPVRERWPAAALVQGAREDAEALRPEWRTEVALDPTVVQPVPRGAFRWVHRVAVLVQRWRWNGRPLRDSMVLPPDGSAAPLPASETPLTAAAFFAAWRAGDDPQLAAWDGQLFGDRESFDYREHEAVVDFGDPGGLEAGAYRVFHQDVSTDAGALYFRYAVRALSRYDGLMERSAPRESRAAVGGQEAWRRLVVPCRHDREIPPPRVKLVLPLTDVRAHGGAGQAEATPGLLVVLNEPWFRYGGLAEELVAELPAARPPEMPAGAAAADAPPSRQEIGPDPLAEAARVPTVVPPEELGPGAHTVRELQVHGPIGYTFDTDTLAPEFVHTAFVVAAPELAPFAAEGEPVRDLSWYFLKLRFRRRLEPGGFADPPAGLVSEATGPLWAQFLPPSSRFAVEGGSTVAVASLRLRSRADAGGPTWLIAEDGSQAPVALRPTPVNPAGEERFQLWALVTQPLFNAYGRLQDERFLDFCPVENGELRPKNPAWAAVTSEPRRARLVEVQVLPGQGADMRLPATPIAAVRDFFFPPDDDGTNSRESRARVVRVSQRIDTSPA